VNNFKKLFLLTTILSHTYVKNLNTSQSEKRFSAENEVRGAYYEIVNNIHVNDVNNTVNNNENDYALETKFYKDLENYILTMVKDISATNMFDIMSIITIKPETEPIKRKSVYRTLFELSLKNSYTK
jgi:hypothetical protein